MTWDIARLDLADLWFKEIWPLSKGFKGAPRDQSCLRVVVSWIALLLSTQLRSLETRSWKEAPSAQYVKTSHVYFPYLQS